MTEQIDFADLYAKVNAIIDAVADGLDAETIEEAQHYLDHAEHEMAFEGLFLDLMALDELPEEIDRSSWIELGKLMKLDEHTVWDDEFWPNFLVFAKTGTLRSSKTPSTKERA